MTTTDEWLSAASEIDLADPLLYTGERPERIWRTLRSAGEPLRAGGDPGYWVMTRYEDVAAVYRNGSLFSSEKGMQLGLDRSAAEAAAEAAAGRMLIVTDDPRHAEIRRAIGAAFTPKMLRRLEDRTTAVAHRLVAGAATGETIDFVEEVAARLPATVICELIGVPDADRDHVTETTQAAFGGATGDPTATQVAAHAELFDYCDHLVTLKRREPADDVATALANATVEGTPMSQEVAVLNCHGLISGGNETTRHASSTTALTLLTAPDQWDLLRAGQVGPDDAAEELLRFSSPANHVLRVATRDQRIGSVTVSAGEYVTLWLGSANHDEDVFDAPDRLRFSRHPNRHVTFGLGSHFCLGAFLARMELRALVRALAEMGVTIEPRGVPHRLASNFLRGYTSMPLALIRR
ncbi:cytochrome P450 [Amycolatopsis saalfeldensis]|uniref:Cytochrome P450 n=1 Tax=Amycolatopsis saalfeldensis TaxID=394193 RepID=A0A1H8Y8T6_9PSEU|nr:cytochrome P450 [Amycolatopsis saalfeldensis]SEP48401.1 Cytochrome P450 [Amycolatopsis saalfeldensis]